MVKKKEKIKINVNREKKQLSVNLLKVTLLYKTTIKKTPKKSKNLA